MMNSFSVKDYILTFYNDSKASRKLFYREVDLTKSYGDLINDSLKLSSYLDTLADTYILLQFESSYELFTHLLAGLFSNKNFLIISTKEPVVAVENYRKKFPFTKIISDQNTTLDINLKELNDVHFNKIVFNILSSGSTGPAKSIPLSLENIYLSSKSVINFFGMSEKHTTLSNLAHNHIGGLMIFWRAFFSGGSITKNLADHYDFISLVPLQLKRILDENKTEIEKLKRCKAVLVGGAIFETELKERARNLNISTYETYGMSETTSLVMLNGIALEGQKVKLGPNGHFLIKSRTITSIMPLDKEGFYHTNDIGMINPDQSFSFLNRDDLLFKSAGEMIDPLKLESIIKTHPSIKNAVVVSVPHRQWTNASTLVYQTDDKNLNENSIKEFFKLEVHPFLIPKYYLIGPDYLMNSEMKPKRFEIKNFAINQISKNKFHYLYIPQNNASKLMVFFHGFMQEYSDMIALMNNHHGLNQLFIDLPGHGKSSIDHFHSREDLLAELSGLITSLQNDNELYFYGYSMGGRIALELLKNGMNPTLTFLESASFGSDNNEENGQRINSDAKLFDNFINHQLFFEKWYRNPIFGNYQSLPQYRDEIEKKSFHDIKQWQKSLNFFSAGIVTRKRRENLEMLKSKKIIVIYGSEDHKYKEHYLEIKAEFPELTLIEIKNAAHNPHKTHLNKIKKIISRYL